MGSLGGGGFGFGGRGDRGKEGEGVGGGVEGGVGVVECEYSVCLFFVSVIRGSGLKKEGNLRCWCYGVKTSVNCLGKKSEEKKRGLPEPTAL